MVEQVDLGAGENSFIRAWMLNDVTVCDKLINHFENVGDTHAGEVIGETGAEVKKEIKDSLDMQLKFGEPVGEEYLNQLADCLQEYKRIYPSCDNVMPYKIEDVNIQKYNPGGAYHTWHTERISGDWDGKRHLVYMTYLNDVTDEGGTEFLHQGITITPKKGLTVIWPVDWTHTHRGLPSMSQSKYIVTGWYRFMEANK